MPQEISKLYKDNTIYSNYDSYLTKILNILNCHLPENEEEKNITDWHNKTKEWLANKLLSPLINFIYKYLELTKGNKNICNTTELNEKKKQWLIIFPKDQVYFLDKNQKSVLIKDFYNIIECYYENKKALKDSLLFKNKFEEFKKDYQEIEKLMSVINKDFSYLSILSKKREVATIINSTVSFYITQSQDLDVRTQLKSEQNILVTNTDVEPTDVEPWEEINTEDEDIISEEEIKPTSLTAKIKKIFKF